MSGWTWLWVFWFAMFFAIELPAALDKKPGGTLSEHIWAWFAVRDKPRGWRVRRSILLAALALLFVHFVSGGGWFIFCTNEHAEAAHLPGGRLLCVVRGSV